MVEKARVFRALGDPTRLKILDLVKSQEYCGTDLVELLEVPQSTLVHHLSTLLHANVIQSRKEGKFVFYSVNRMIWDRFCAPVGL